VCRTQKGGENMTIEEKEKRLERMLNKLSGDEIKELMSESYVNGLESGMRAAEVKYLGVACSCNNIKTA